jgi:hypothetical protein
MQHNATGYHRKQEQRIWLHRPGIRIALLEPRTAKLPFCHQEITPDAMKLNALSGFGFVPPKSRGDPFRPRIQARASQMA